MSDKEKDKFSRLRPLESLTAAEVGWIFGVTHNAVGLWHAEHGCPRHDESMRYNLRDVVRWRMEWVKRTADKDADLDLAGSSSPALERYRTAKAELAELDLQTKRQQLLPRDDIRLMLSRLATIIRGACETLQKLHGPDAKRIMDDALDGFIREVDRSIP